MTVVRVMIGTEDRCGPGPGCGKTTPKGHLSVHIPSLDHAAVKGDRAAKRPRESTENFMIAYSAEDGCG